MNTLTNEQLAARVMELAQSAGPFRPSAYYDPDGDCIEFLACPDNFYGERVDDLVTVYLSEESGEIVGALLKGVTGFCERTLQKLPGFKIEIEHGRVKLVAIFTAGLWSTDINPDHVKTVRAYKKLIDVATQTGVEVQLKRAA